MRPSPPTPHPPDHRTTLPPRVLHAALVLGCLLAGVVTALAPPRVQAGGAQIYGRFVDGTVPVAGIQVNLSNGDGQYLNQSVLSQADGAFAFGGLSAGVYKIDFSDTAAPSRYVLGFYNGKPNIETADPITLAESDEADLHDIQLTRAAHLGGRVTRTDTGAPLPGIDVEFYVPEPAAPSGWRMLTRVATQDDGRYTLGGLAAGPYRICFVDGSFSHFAGACYRNAPTLAQAEDVVLAVGATRADLDIALAPFAQISGHVAGADGEMLGGVHACLLAPQATPPPSGLWQIPESCVYYGVSASDGAYTIGALPAGAFRLIFVDRRWPPHYFDQIYSDKTTFAQADTITLQAGQTLPDVDAKLRPAGAIAGRAQAGGLPLADADVRLYQSDDGGWRWLQSARTNRDGDFAFQTVISDTYRVGFVDPLGRYAPIYHAGDVEELRSGTNITGSTGALVPNVDGVLKAGGALEGCVLGAGAPLPGALVSLYFARGEWLAQTTTNAQGCYRFTGVGLEEYVVYARDGAGLYAPAYAGGATLDKAQKIAGTAGLTLIADDINLVAAPPLVATTSVTPTGFVRSGAGAPLGGAVVTLYKLPGLRARVAPWEAEPFTCPSAASAAVWGEAAPPEGALFANPEAEGIVPPFNPQITRSDGAYGWVLPSGCWFVRVAKAGYAAAASAVAGAPPVIADLNVTLVALPTTPAPTSTKMPVPTATQRPAATQTPVPPTATATAGAFYTPTPLPVASATARAPTPTPPGAPTPTPTATLPGAAVATATPAALATPTPALATGTPNGSTPAAATPTPAARVLLPFVQR